MSDLEQKVKDLERRLYNLEKSQPFIAVLFVVLFGLILLVGQ